MAPNGPPTPKILTREQLALLREQARQQERVVVQCHGCFDIVHPGHIRHLQHAAKQGDVLLVSITADAVMAHVRRLEGLESHSQDRTVALRADETVSPGKFRPDPLLPGGWIANSLTIRAVRPDIFVAGDLDQLALERPCGGCGQILDLQFWRLCPHCARPTPQA